MSNINDLYKESGIKPGGGFDGNFKGSPKPPGGKNKKSLLISYLIAAVLVVAAYFIFDSGRHGSGREVRVDAVLIIPVAYLINFFIKLFMRLSNKMNE
jgi:hypothetical protein